ncbi:MAG: hypothetical protein A2Y63_02810 [Candidatus Riflebacteria bacterium RBG_13_59_9]|nr:MAG: hypothetical protein A2Y63_02810 [Candidatus Riflebacteria bacterium RBG_13_59_9]
MPNVRKEIIVNAPPERVFAIAREVERFPAVMHDLKSVEVLEREGARTVSRWVSVAEIGPLSREVVWEEEEFWDEDALTGAFKLVKGDLKSYGGAWMFTPEGGSTRVVLDFDYEIDIPLLGAMVHKIIHQKMMDNCDSLLKALKRLAEG